jgi:hypothetical protein
MPEKKFKRRSGLLPPEKKLPERRSVTKISLDIIQKNPLLALLDASEEAGLEVNPEKLRIC